jgi:hypothetical protein
MDVVIYKIIYVLQSPTTDAKPIHFVVSVPVLCDALLYNFQFIRMIVCTTYTQFIILNSFTQQVTKYTVIENGFIANNNYNFFHILGAFC